MMNEQACKLAEAVYKIRSKEKMIRATFEQGAGHTRAYLEERIQIARDNTKKELKTQVKQGYLKEADAANILKEFELITTIDNPEPQILVATFPEFIMNEFYVRSVAVELNDTNRQAETKA
jgi:hypothetical protein